MCRKNCFVINIQVMYFNVLNVSMDVKIRAAVIFFINKNNLLIIQCFCLENVLICVTGSPKPPKLSIYNNIKHTKSTNSLTGEAGTRIYCQSFFLSINLFSVDRCIVGFRCWKDSGMSCCVRCCKHSGHAADQCGSEIALSSFMCHCLTSLRYLGHPFFCFVFFTEVSF